MQMKGTHVAWSAPAVLAKSETVAHRHTGPSAELGWFMFCASWQAGNGKEWIQVWVG